MSVFVHELGSQLLQKLSVFANFFQAYMNTGLFKVCLYEFMKRRDARVCVCVYRYVYTYSLYIYTDMYVYMYRYTSQ